MKTDESDSSSSISHKREEEGENGGRGRREVILKETSYQFKVNIRSDCSSAPRQKAQKKKKKKKNEAQVERCNQLLQAREGCVHANGRVQGGFRAKPKPEARLQLPQRPDALENITLILIDNQYVLVNTLQEFFYIIYCFLLINKPTFSQPALTSSSSVIDPFG